MSTRKHSRSLPLLATLALAAAMAGAVSYPALAKPAASTQQALQKQTFSIEHMTCAMCPITVRVAMKKVDGVKSVKVDFEAKTASVTYDPSKASASDIAAASTKAGYPAHPSSN